MLLSENDRLQDKGIFLFSGEVDDPLCTSLIEYILNQNLEGQHEFLTLIINSYGGYLTSGFSCIDVIHGSSIPIHTVGLGVIASMGLMLFITGKKGYRTLTPNTLIMSHQWSGGSYGKEHELIAAAKANTLISDMFLKHYKKHTGLSEKKIKDYLLPPSDVYLTAYEAKQLGICDEVKELV